MNKIFKYILVFIVSFLFIIPVNAKENNNVKLYLFYGEGCPHCAAEKKFLVDYEDKIEMEYFEVWDSEDNRALYNKVKEAYKFDRDGVPFTIIGNTYFIGYNSNIGDNIAKVIEYYQTHEYTDQVVQIIDGTYDGHEIIDDYENNKSEEVKEEEKQKEEQFMFEVPILGKVDLRRFSLTTSAFFIGIVDGFNPCAMWVLIFLISILIGMKNKKRMISLGLTFLLTSALIYGIIMFSWINIAVKITTSLLIRNIIGIIAIVGGVYNLYSFIKSLKEDDGCNVTSKASRKKTIDKIKKFTSEKSFLLALVGVAGLAVSVNLIEFACSAGLPLLFSQLLAINGVSGIESIYYTFLYLVFFLLDDLIVFFIAVFTMNVTGISNKYNKYSHLIGGIIMLIIGILLIFNYKLLTFGI